jgi:outer membrane usher protein
LTIDQWVTGATSDYDTNELRLDITIAQAFLTKQNRQSVPPEMLTRGENAGFINYNLNNYNTQGFSSNFLGLNTGINLSGWQLRHTSYASQNRSTGSASTSQYVSGETVVKRPLLDIKSTLVLGDTTSSSPIIGSTPIRGVRLSSEEAMMPDEERSFRPIIRGVARTNARVRVSQNNVVFFEQTVPPGPFEFDDINPVASVGNLQVVIAEADGSQQTFVVPYSPSMGALNPGSFRYSVATGHYRNFTTTQNTTVVQAYVRYGLNNFLSPGAEVLLGPNYSNIGLQASFSSAMGSMSFSSLFSHFSVNGNNNNGSANNISFSPPAMGRFSAYAGLGRQSQRYTPPSTAFNLGSNAVFTNDSFKSNVFVGSGLGMGQWGALSLGLTQQRNWQDQGNQQVRLGYSFTVSKVNLGINFDRTTYTNHSPSVRSMSINASVPLNLGSTQGGLQAGYTQVGESEPTKTVGFYGFSSENQLSYNLNQSQTANLSTSSGSASLQHRYGNVGASISSSTGGSQQTGLSASGGLVLHRDGIILAPALGDTFAIVEVPKGEGAGVLGSSARINSGGFGVVPSLSPYYLNDVQISLEGASSGLEVDNASQKVAPVEGSIVRLKFNASSGRPLLIVLQTPSGLRVPIGATVSDAQGNEVGTVGQGSRALVRVQKPKDRLTVKWGDKADESCWLDYALDDKQTANASGYTLLKLRCDMNPMGEKSAQAGK